MSMQITSDANTQKILNTYNSNQAHAEKSFDRISSGLKIVNAGNNSSAWSISERMRNLIRALSQNHQNVQNDSALIRTAERGIDQIVQNLRYMKELAIDSANDSNTNEDRKSLQKEFAQHMKAINDIVETTEYNGKVLLDGTWTDEGLKILKAINEGGGIDRLVSNFTAGENTNVTSSLKSFGGATNSSGSTSWFSFDADVGFKGSSGFTHMAYIDFSGMNRKYGYVATLHNQGFSLLCGGCTQYINVRFDGSTTSSSYTSLSGQATTINNDTKSAPSTSGEYIVGIQGVTNPTELADAFYNGIKNVNGTHTTGEVLFDNRNHTITLGLDNGKLYIKQNGGSSMLFKAGLIPNDNMTDLPPIDMPDIYYQPLWAQHGAESGQRFHMYINDLHTSAIGLDDTDVSTRDNAESAIARCDTALENVLEELTNMGAYLQRLEATDLNVTTLNENLQASESTIRDADMAKEMVDYTRYRMLTRSSQAMLAQANQNQKSVAGLTK